MGKGGGGGGHGGNRGSMSVSATQGLIARAGGLFRAVTAEDPERFDASSLAKGRLEQVNAAYQGATPGQVNAIATGKRDVQGGSGKRLPPIRVTVSRDRDGKVSYHIEDGRNRSLGARAAGATHIRALVSREEQGPRGKWRFSKPVEIIIKL
jgi:hypothetical protein